MEIERKYRIGGFPEAEGWTLLEEAVVYQGYLATHPVVRIRSKRTDKKNDYVLCFKGEGTLVRQEIEIPLSEEIFTELLELLPAPMVRKDYRVYRLPDGHKLECSLVDGGTPGAFYYAEVEFGSVEESEVFVPPAFLGEEVTEDPDFSMSRYWQKRLEKAI